MELDKFIRVLMRRWYIPVMLVVLAIVGVWLYQSYTRETTASASVVVLAPIPAPGEFVPPQFGFDQIDESSELSERVAAQLDDGTTADELKGRITVSVRMDPNQRSTSPLYSVSARDPDSARAIKIANIAAEEAKELYADLNRYDREDVRLAFEEEIAQAEADVNTARADLEAFMQTNDAYSLPTRASQQSSLVAQLEVSAARSGDQANAAITDAPSLQEARAELERLTALEPEYNRLQFDLSLAQSSVTRLESLVSELQITGSAQLNEAQSQLNEERARLAAAQSALGNFSSSSEVSNLSAAVQSQAATVNQLVIAEANASHNAGELAAALNAERVELDRLNRLEPEYTRLSNQLKNAEDNVVSLERQVLNIVTNQSLPARTQVKIFDTAQIESDMFFTMITYALALLVAVLVAISIVYFSALFERVPPTNREIEQTLGAAIMAQVPRKSG
jgi:capsular polysaccharide biosynthesis protein